MPPAGLVVPGGGRAADDVEMYGGTTTDDAPAEAGGPPPGIDSLGVIVKVLTMGELPMVPTVRVNVIVAANGWRSGPLASGPDGGGLEVAGPELPGTTGEGEMTGIVGGSG